MNATQSQQNAAVSRAVAAVVRDAAFDATLADDLEAAANARAREWEAECQRLEQSWASRLSKLDTPHG